MPGLPATFLTIVREGERWEWARPDEAARQNEHVVRMGRLDLRGLAEPRRRRAQGKSVRKTGHSI